MLENREKLVLDHEKRLKTSETMRVERSAGILSALTAVTSLQMFCT